MKKIIQWDKHVAIGTYILIALTITIFLLDRFLPTDAEYHWSLRFFSGSIVIRLWLAILLVCVIFLITLLFARWMRNKRPSAAIIPPLESTAAPIDAPGPFEILPSSLDPRITDPNVGIYHTAKLRLAVRNVSGKSVEVRPLRWLSCHDNVSLQCGASPFPDVPFRIDSLGIGFRYQLEDSLGSWRQGKWKRSNNKDEEHTTLTVPPGFTFRIWIGLNPCVPHTDLEKKRNGQNLGILILPVKIDEQVSEIKIPL